MRPRLVPPSALDTLVAELRTDGYRVLGPIVRDGAIVYDEVSGTDDLPRGWGDEQGPGRYRVHQGGDERLFAYAVGPTTWKRELFPPRQPLWSAERVGDTGFVVTEAPAPTERLALLGVRACELAAIAVQDRVLLQGPAPDRVYAARREDAVLVAVTCGSPSGTCFCASMGTGPRPGAGADLVLTELTGDEHALVVEAWSARGEALLAVLPGRDTTDRDLERVEQVAAQARDAMGRQLDPEGLPELLASTLDHPRWDDVAARCLTCGNCTLVCPTCFCTQVEDTTDLTGQHAERNRRWDSCFTLEFSHAGPASVRSSARSRYRQWLTHKLGTWVEQFGTSGCVGCGRCIAWCPVGIDLTEEVAALRGERVPTPNA